MTKLLSVVVSVYNEELALREFYAETGKILKRLPGNWDYEFLFVNDGSRDQSLSLIHIWHSISAGLKRILCQSW